VPGRMRYPPALDPRGHPRVDANSHNRIKGKTLAQSGDMGSDSIKLHSRVTQPLEVSKYRRNRGRTGARPRPPHQRLNVRHLLEYKARD
jgi:hypothetical protein